MPTVITEGAMAARGFGFGASGTGAANYIEDVFSTYLYTGTGATQTITNGIDLSGKGGLVWFKNRGAAGNNLLLDTARGAGQLLLSNLTNGNTSYTGFSSFNSNGFTLNVDPGSSINASGNTYASWSFREQAKFFDIVTYTGTGANRTIAHNLGSTPGCIIVKRTDTTSDWQVYHSGLTSAAYSIQLNLTDGQASAPTVWNSTAPTSSVFSVGTSTDVNASGGTYIAYIYASNAGGFGAAGTDNVITCGTFTTDGSGNASVTLGYEPQWVMVKSTVTTGNWRLYDNMRGMTASGTGDRELNPNTSDAEAADTGVRTNATGFAWAGLVSEPYIYIAIRRGPMKTPTDATKVFGPNARTGTGANATVTGGQTDDAVLIKNRASAVVSLFSSRLTGIGYLSTSATTAQTTAGAAILQANPWDVMDGVKVGTTSTITNASANTFVNYLFQRAPGFFDVVCYTGTGANTTQTHNLGVVPELMIVKGRSGATAWQVYSSALANTEYLVLNTTAAKDTGATRWNSTTPTSTVFSLGTVPEVNTSAATYVAYLFATCTGVSKVGSYSGTGATQTIDCGFPGGARFVLIKRTDTTGDWYAWDTARGMVAGTDPSWLLNTTAAEVNANSVYTIATGFQIVSTAAGINASGGTYIFLAIA
jgi:hypothetical protein